MEAEPRNKFKCSKCKATFMFFTGLRKHELKHEEFARNNKHKDTGQTNAKNNVCSTTENNESKLKYQCAICDKYYKENCYLLRHISLKHFSIKKFTCHHCNGKFSAKSNLAYHIRNTHGQDENTCTCKCVFCGTCFKNKQRLSNHLTKTCRMNTKSVLDKINMQEISSNCNEGSETQNNNLDVKWGIDIRKAEKVNLNGKIKYKCSICGRLLEKFYSLQRHLKIHNPDKQYKCSFCESKLKSLYHLRIHLRSIHNIKCKDLFETIPKDKKSHTIKKSNNTNQAQEKYNIENLSMPILNDEKIASSTINNINCSKSQKQNNFNQRIEKHSPNTDNSKQIELIQYSEPRTEITYSVPVFKDALIGQANAILIEKVKNESVNPEPSITLETTSVIDDVNCETTYAGDDYILNSEWYMFDCDISSNSLKLKEKSDLVVTMVSLADADKDHNDLKIIGEYTSSKTLNNKLTNNIDINCDDSSLINVSLDLNNLSFETDKDAISFGNNSTEENSTSEKLNSNILTKFVDNMEPETFVCDLITTRIQDLQNSNCTTNVSTPIQNPVNDNFIQSLQSPFNGNNNIGTSEETPLQNSIGADFNYPCVTNTITSNVDMEKFPDACTVNNKSINNIDFNKELEKLTNELIQCETSNQLQDYELLNKTGTDESYTEKDNVDSEIEKLVNSFIGKEHDENCDKLNNEMEINIANCSNIMTPYFSNSTKLIKGGSDNSAHFVTSASENKLFSYSNEISENREELQLISPNLITLLDTQTPNDDFPNDLSQINDAKDDNMENSTCEKILCWVCGRILKKASVNRHKCLSTYRYKCPICNEEFITYSAKKRHVIKHIKDTMPIQCEEKRKL